MKFCQKIIKIYHKLKKKIKICLNKAIGFKKEVQLILEVAFSLIKLNFSPYKKKKNNNKINLKINKSLI